MKTNLCVIGQAPNFTRNIAKALADRLDMGYASVNEMLEFDIGSLIEAKDLVGAEYIEKLENQKIRTLLDFENAVITLDIQTFIRGDNAKNINKFAYIVFLDLPYELMTKLYKKQETKPEDFDLQMMVYGERSEFCGNISDFHEKLTCLDKRKIVNQILKDLSFHEYS